MKQKVPQRYLIVDTLLANQRLRKKTKEKYEAEKDNRGRKHGNRDGDKDETKTKRRFKNSVIRSARSANVVAAKPSTPTTAPTLTKSSPSNRDCRSSRHVRSDFGSKRYVSRATRHKENEIKNDRKRSVIGSLTSILGPEDDSGTWDWHLGSGTKSTETAVAADDEISPTTRKRRTSKRGFVAISMRPDTEKHEEQDKHKNVKNTKGGHLDEDEDKIRRQIRAKLRKNQQKHSALAVVLASVKGKSTSNQDTSTIPASTPSSEYIRSWMTKTHDTASNTTSQQPRLRSRARSRRLYSVCKRIPESIPEDSILEIKRYHPRRTSVSNERSNASNDRFTDRASNYHNHTRKQRKCSTIKPLSTESERSCRDSHDGGMAFKTNGGRKLEQAIQMQLRQQRKKRLIFNSWVDNQ